MNNDNIASELGRLLDAELLDMLQNGRTEVLDDGSTITRKLTAAELTVIIKRVQQHGVAGVATPGSTQKALIDEARRRKLGLTGTDPIPLHRPIDEDGLPKAIDDD